jgi:type VI protein secretion system component Hcp
MIEGNQFLELDKIKGDSEISGFENLIRVRGWSLSLSANGSRSTAGGAQVGPMTLMVSGNTAVMGMALALQNDVALKGAITITAVDGQGGHKKVTKWQIEQVKITNVDFSGYDGLTEVETPVTMTVGVIKPETKAPKDDGTVGPSSGFNYNVKKGKMSKL